MKDIGQPRDMTMAQVVERYEALVRDLSVLRLLDDMDSIQTSPEAVMARVVGALAREDLAEQCSIMLLHPQRGELVLQAVGTRYANQGFAIVPDGWNGKQFALGEGIAGHVAVTRKTMRVNDTDHHPRFLSLPDSPVTVRSLLCHPLIADGILLGVLNLSHSMPAHFSQDREHGAHLIAQRVAALLFDAQGHHPPKVPTPFRRNSSGSQEALGLNAEHYYGLGEIAGSIAHELDQRLLDLTTCLDRALSQESLETTRKLITRAQQDGSRSVATVKKLLAFADAVTSPRASEPVDVLEIFQATQSSLPHQSDRLGSLSIEVPDDLPPLEGDRERLLQVFINLCSNAIDALNLEKDTNGTFCLRLGAERVRCVHDEAGPWGDSVSGTFIRAFVSDNGIGMTPGCVRRACDPFFTTKPGGTGLGLTTAFQVARQHGGWLELHSALDQGTTVSLFLATLPESSVLLHSSSQQKIGESPSTMTILLVDDEAIIRKLGAAILKKLGYTAITVDSGQAAIDVYEDSATPPIDLAIIDVNMPGMNGRALLEYLRKGNPRLPIILSSGGLEECEHAVAPQYTATAYLQKPYLIATMAEVIEQALQQH